jgi:hypothetical protein
VDDGSTTTRARIPGRVQLAIYLVAISCLTALVRAILMKDWAQPISAIIGLAVLAELCALWIYGLYRGKNWIRWITVLFFVIHFAVTPWALAIFHDTRQVAMYWLQCLSGVLAAILLCMPIARQWFTSPSVT